MAIFRQYIAPLLVVLVFLLALVVVSARIFLPADMAAPAPIEEVDQVSSVEATTPNGELLRTAKLPVPLELFVEGLPPEPLSTAAF
ncbi:hypothetical protein H6G89_13905 [Oscillatoria sp. FACHB-1407]|uniref:hypothetical protein n=1 Tax=Oscillatoria sp. FACHB-1407 TaxID=2692847 RepID=UPI001689EA6F|nr:hypothetical protein [Oscillatoria sp. FACHB-1407]MBD2462142.1 hypothetical protein [Oscillatoria sp. FACHB-1407]